MVAALPPGIHPPGTVLNLSSGLAFAAFLVLAVATAATPKRGPAHRRRVARFIVATVVISLAPGITGRDFWPFSSWQMMRWTSPSEVTAFRLLSIAEDGTTGPIDYRVWQPLSLEELISWFEREFPALSPTEQDSAAVYLLRLANGALERWRRGERLGWNFRWLGALTAPTHLLHPEIWSSSGAAPTRISGFRLVRESWIVNAGRRPGSVAQVVLYQFPRRP